MSTKTGAGRRVGFIVKDHGMREVKNQISREILAAFDAARLGIASATVEIVGLPSLRVEGLPTLSRAEKNRSASGA